MKKKLYGAVLAGLLVAAVPATAFGATTTNNWFSSLHSWSTSWVSVNFNQLSDTSTNTSTVTDNGNTRTYHYIFGTGIGSSLEITITVTLPQSIPTT